MKKIICIISASLLLFLLANMFVVYHNTLNNELISEMKGGKVIGERSMEIWGVRYNPIWYEAFR